jgi:hypothetical protein
MKYDRIEALNIDHHSNQYELTMLDVGRLHAFQLTLTDTTDTNAYFISTIYIARGHYYQWDSFMSISSSFIHRSLPILPCRIDVHQWIEHRQTLNGTIQTLSMPWTSNVFNQADTSIVHGIVVGCFRTIRLESSLILWLQVSDLLKTSMNLLVEFRFQCQKTSMTPIEQTVRLQPNSIVVLALATTWSMPVVNRHCLS